MGGEAGVGAFGEVSEGEEGPDEEGSGGPGVECAEDGDVFIAEPEEGGERGEEEAGRREGGDRQKQDGVGAEGLEVGSDEEGTGEEEGGEDGEEAGIPELLRVDLDEACGALREGEGEQEAEDSKRPEGGEDEVSGVKEVGVHWIQFMGFEAAECDKLEAVSGRSAVW